MHFGPKKYKEVSERRAREEVAIAGIVLQLCEGWKTCSTHFIPEVEVKYSIRNIERFFYTLEGRL